MALKSNEIDDGNIDPATIASTVKSSVKQELIKELMNSNKMTIGNDALSLLVEAAKCLVVETCLRATKQAMCESRDTVDIEHVEKCLPQMMLDFP